MRRSQSHIVCIIYFLKMAVLKMLDTENHDVKQLLRDCFFLLILIFLYAFYTVIFVSYSLSCPLNVFCIPNNLLIITYMRYF